MSQSVSKTICSRCEGKGHVWDDESLVCYIPIMLLVALLEEDTHDGMTRRTCPQCHGRGYL